MALLYSSKMAASMARILTGPNHRIFALLPALCSTSTSLTSPVVCRFSSAPGRYSELTEVPPKKSDKGIKISAAMKAYLERAHKHDVFMKEEIAEFEIGKRHLANIMGADPDNFTQEDIDEAIQYLLPSGLFEKKARPILKHPEEVFPKKKAPQFGLDGRPFHPFFYTGYPNYYMIMFEASQKYDELKKYEDQMWEKGLFSADDQTAKVMAANSEWISLDDLQNSTLEKVDEHHYRRLLVLLERIMSHPYCVREKEFLNQFRKPLVIIGLTDEIEPPKEAENGRLYAEAEGKRKSATANVRLWGDGSGKVSINGYGLLDYFPEIMDREQIAFPLQFTNKLMTMDIEATVEGGGPSGQAGAIRLALSRALMSFVDKDMVERIRLVGLLTKDPRRRERKKPGQPKARKKYIWKKR